MPELPEVETSRRGIDPHITGKVISEVVVHNSALRWPVPDNLAATLQNQAVVATRRRGKYILIDFPAGSLLIHLGMSGSLRLCQRPFERLKHDHVTFDINGGMTLVFNDPRRFGCVLWVDSPDGSHELLDKLGVEPLESDFDGELLHRLSRGRKVAVKQFIMDGHIVVGVGNIYASEALFMSGIHPHRQAGRVSLQRYQLLAQAVKEVLAKAIKQGGTTLRDFINSDGQPGYFKQQLGVYDRAGEPCRTCAAPIKMTRTGQRATYYCPRCQN